LECKTFLKQQEYTLQHEWDLGGKALISVPSSGVRLEGRIRKGKFRGPLDGKRERALREDRSVRLEREKENTNIRD